MNAFGADPTRDELIRSMMGRLGPVIDGELRVADRHDKAPPPLIAGHRPDLHGVSDGRLILAVAAKESEWGDDDFAAKLRAFATHEDADGYPPTLWVWTTGDREEALAAVKQALGSAYHDRIDVATLNRGNA